MNNEECDCLCHKQSGVLHMFPCCNQCPKCSKNIKRDHLLEHTLSCHMEGFTIEDSWQRYAKHCLKNVPEDSVQYKETKKAFYSGMFSLSNKTEVISELPASVGVQIYGKLIDEINEYVKNQLEKESK